MNLPLLLALTTFLGPGGPAGPDDLLPETPPGWRYERMDLPLAFAPELEYEGFEELRFAPGMFEPDSDSYFSYVFAIRIEEALSADADFLRTFLERYYLGLCRSVAESRELEVDLSGFSVTVVPEDATSMRPIEATIEMVDAFGSGAPLTLAVELHTHAGPEHTEVLGLASPLPRDASVWDDLRAVGDAWRRDRAVPAFLNHFYVVPDAATYAALVADPFLASLAVRETRTTVRTDLTYTGLYLYGDTTYFEFLEPSEAFPPGNTGIAFGFERAGGAEATATALRGRGLEAYVVPITRAYESEQVPWFHMLGITAPADSNLSLFALEYDPRFLASWYPELPPAAASIERAAILDRYAHVLAEGGERQVANLVDVTAIHLELDAKDTAHLGRVCAALGYAPGRADGALVHDGPGVRISIQPAARSRGVVAFDLALRTPIEREPLVLGRARFTFRGATARFELLP